MSSPERRGVRAALLILLALGAGCGYRFTAAGAPLPDGIREVHIPIFQNHTGEPGLETLFTESLRERAGRAGTLGTRGSEARIEGDILSVSNAVTLTQVSGRPGYRLVCTARVKLFRGDSLVSQGDVQGQEDYTATTSDTLTLESARQAAFHRLSERLMDDAYQRLAGG